MLFREAEIKDIEQMMILRLAVKENTLSDPSLVPYEDMVKYMTIRGKGWVCELNKVILGFAIVDLEKNSVWALFTAPGHEGKGIGKELQRIMLSWYFSKTDQKISLDTAAGTRAEKFYMLTGWKEVKRTEKQPKNADFPTYTEVVFEMTSFNN